MFFLALRSITVIIPVIIVVRIIVHGVLISVFKTWGTVEGGPSKTAECAFANLLEVNSLVLAADTNDICFKNLIYKCVVLSHKDRRDRADNKSKIYDLTCHLMKYRKAIVYCVYTNLSTTFTFENYPKLSIWNFGIPVGWRMKAGKPCETLRFQRAHWLSEVT